MHQPARFADGLVLDGVAAASTGVWAHIEIIFVVAAVTAAAAAGAHRAITHGDWPTISEAKDSTDEEPVEGGECLKHGTDKLCRYQMCVCGVKVCGSYQIFSVHGVKVFRSILLLSLNGCCRGPFWLLLL